MGKNKERLLGSSFPRRAAFLAAFCAAGFFVSCGTTRNAAFIPFDQAVARHEYLAAVEGLEEAADSEDGEDLYREGKDEVLRYLDAGMLYHIAGVPGQSIDRLNRAEELIEDNYTQSVSDAALSFLLNDYSLVYFGEAYEDIYLNIFKALDYLKAGSFDDAYVEIQRVGEKLNFLEDKYGRLADSMNESEEAGGAIQEGEIEFHNSALARYLSILIYRADRRQDSAALDMDQLKRAFADQPNVYDFPPPADLDNILAPARQARLNVIAFAGPGPEKRASALRITTQGGLVVITQEEEDNFGNMRLKNLVPIPLPLAVPGMNFKVAIPSMRSRDSRVTRIRVLVDGKPAGDLSLLEKLDRVAMETFKLNESIILTRTVIRAVLTGAVTTTAKQLTDELTKDSAIGSLLSLVGGAALDIAADIKEEADLRLARYFPGKAYVGEFLVDPGEHDIAIEFCNAAGGVLYSEGIPRREYTAAKLNLLTAYDLE
jgi:hypothetical protein